MVLHITERWNASHLISSQICWDRLQDSVIEISSKSSSTSTMDSKWGVFRVGLSMASSQWQLWDLLASSSLCVDSSCDWRRDLQQNFSALGKLLFKTLAKTLKNPAGNLALLTGDKYQSTSNQRPERPLLRPCLWKRRGFPASESTSHLFKFKWSRGNFCQQQTEYLRLDHQQASGGWNIHHKSGCVRMRPDSLPLNPMILWYLMYLDVNISGKQHNDAT